MAALALTLDPAMLTAAVTITGYDQCSSVRCAGWARRGDVLFGITTSGRSANVVRALQAAREMGIVTVGLLGGSGQPALDALRPVLLVPDDGNGTHPGMSHRPRPWRAGTARGPADRPAISMNDRPP